MFALNQNNFLKHEVDVNPSFDFENTHKNRDAKLKSMVVTAVSHGLLLLLLLFYFALKPADPPLSETGGVYLNLGLVDIGSGLIQPEGTASQLEAPAPVASSASSQQKNDNILTQQTNEDVPVMQKEEKKKNTVTKDQSKKNSTQKNSVETPPKPKPKALYPGSQANSSTSEGTGNVKGDQGKPNGDVNGTSYTGNPGIGNGPGGNGGGPQLGMSGRKIISSPIIIDNSQKTGRVVVNIKVDKDGNVVWAKATQKGSTTTDSYLLQLAVDNALKIKVNADPTAAEEQFGTITYTFRVK